MAKPMPGFRPARRLPVRPVAALLSAALLLALAACPSREDAFRESLARAAADRDGQLSLETLLALDQEFPDRLVLKINIGALYLAAGDPERAAVYLQRGRTLAARTRDPHLRYLLHANLAELHLRRGRHAPSIGEATRALRLQPEDPLGVIFTRAKAHLASGAAPAALRDFQAGAATADQRMNLEDWSAWIRAHLASGQLEPALALYRQRQRRFGYLPGQGLEESAAFESLGRIEEAVLSAFMEGAYLQAGTRGGTEAPGSGWLRANTSTLAERLTDPQLNPQRLGGSLLEGLGAYLEADWAAAAGALGRVTLAAPHPFLDFLRGAVAVELAAAGPPGGADAAPAAAGDGPTDARAGAPIDAATAAAAGATPLRDALVRYGALEEMFKDLQPYYHHLWRGMRAAGSFGPAAMRPVLEKTILLGRDSAHADASRLELGRLLGLDPDQGRKLLLEAEMRTIAEHATARRLPARLEPLLELLALPDSLYTLQATLIVQQVLGDPAMRAYLERRRLDSAGRLHERLSGLLGPAP